MDLNIVLAVICGAVALVGAFCVVFQIYHMTVIDATARGLKHPKFWGVFTMSGNNSSGLLMYLIGRRKYPIVNMSESNSKELEKRKKSAGVGLLFLAIGVIGIICATLIWLHKHSWAEDINTVAERIRRTLESAKAKTLFGACPACGAGVWGDPGQHMGICTGCGQQIGCVLASWRPLCERCFSAV